MNPRQLEAFNAVMEGGSVTGAAVRLGVSQPAISKLLMSLERETGLLLFRREHRRLIPTAEARLLQDEARRYFSEMARISRFATEVRHLRAGKVTIASFPALGTRVLPRILHGFVKEKPSIRLELRVRPSPTVIDWAVNQQVDLGIAVMPIDHPAVHCHHLAQMQAVCVLPADHRLSAHNILRPKDFAGEPFVSLGSEDRARHQIDAIFEQAGIERHLQIETQFSEVACAFVANGAGLSIVDSVTADAFRGDALAVRPFEPGFSFDIYLLRSAISQPSLLVDSLSTELQAAAQRGF